jgi:hypothetical protein
VIADWRASGRVPKAMKHPTAAASEQAQYLVVRATNTTI